MRKLLATMAVASLTAWVAPASAGVIATHEGDTLTRDGTSSFEVIFDLSDVFDAKLTFKTDGSYGIDACDDEEVHKRDCLSVFANGDLIPGLNPNPISVSRHETKWSTPIGIDDSIVTLRFDAVISAGSEYIDVSNIKVSTVSEPAAIALFGLGLTGLGLVRRRRAV